MTVFVLSVVIIALIMSIMAVGVLSGRGPIKGSCGGIGALGMDTACDICGGDPKRCEEETRDEGAGQQAVQHYPAGK